MPVRRMTDEEADRIFGNGLIILGRHWEPATEIPNDEPASLNEKGNPCLGGSTNGDTARST
jgi:hypothetical protein